MEPIVFPFDTEQSFTLSNVDCTVIKSVITLCYTLIKRKIKFSSYIRKFRVKQLQSHIEEGFLIMYMRKCANISLYMRRPLVTYDFFATAPFWISLCMRTILFSFLSVYPQTFMSLNNSDTLLNWQRSAAHFKINDIKCFLCIFSDWMYLLWAKKQILLLID